MKLKKAVKKIVALGTGVTMLGATLFGATAADLGNYPSPMFINDGEFSGNIVVGESAKAADVIGAVDIATSLQAAAVKKVPISGGASGTTVVSDG
ncbi:MAG: S-layer protein, partial [Nanobdellota archaeon]